MSIFTILLRTVLGIAVAVLVVLLSLWYGQNHGLLPVQASEQAPLVDGLFNFMMTIATGIFLLVQGILVYSLFVFKRRRGDNSDAPPVHGNVPLEIVWTAIPTVIVTILAIYSFDVYKAEGGIETMTHPAVAHVHHEQPFTLGSAAYAATLPESDALLAQSMEMPGAVEGSSQIEVSVAALRYGWLFSYADLPDVVDGELHVPVGREVNLKITANDVNHAFWVPEFRLKQDAIPGRETVIHFKPTRVGQYVVRCAELCGPYHGAMNTNVIVHTPEEYETWHQEQLVASREAVHETVAVAPVQTAQPAFLAAHVQELGIQPATLSAFRSAMAHSHQPAAVEAKGNS